VAYFEVHIVDAGDIGYALLPQSLYDRTFNASSTDSLASLFVRARIRQVMVGIALNHFPRSLAPAGWRKGYPCSVINTRRSMVDDLSCSWLPGFRSYGYHADDGRVFAQSGIGRKWGPTFTTGDVIGASLGDCAQLVRTSPLTLPTLTFWQGVVSIS
jgi:hypothetical protein